VTRFAPSPTGLLHIGHAYAALFAARAAAGGRFLVRMEDIDVGRCRPEFEDAVYEDLAWLGLEWETPVRRQSDHLVDYARALARLARLGVAYPCFCTRREIEAEIERAGHAPHEGTGPVYPGTCRRLSAEDRRRRFRDGAAYALRIDAYRAMAMAEHDNGGPMTWVDRDAGEVACDASPLGDVVIARKDTPTSYHLAVTIDDHLQGVTLVTRGRDLFECTHVHRLLQGLLGLDVPTYRHHDLLTNEAGQRLAKRDAALTIRALRDAGHTPADVRAMAGFGDGGQGA
jgi:glutamyl-Q tRNA(Asp) synthetase